MTIETKLNIGNSIWIIHDNVVKKGNLINISIECNHNKPNFEITIEYLIDTINKWVNENNFNKTYFRTKEELIKSL